MALMSGIRSRAAVWQRATAMGFFAALLLLDSSAAKNEMFDPADGQQDVPSGNGGGGERSSKGSTTLDDQQAGGQNNGGGPGGGGEAMPTEVVLETQIVGGDNCGDTAPYKVCADANEADCEGWAKSVSVI
jgi:hypothetical protein